MLKRISFIWVVLILATAGPAGLFAQAGGIQLIGIGPEAVALGLSEATTARPMQGTSVFTNPANLTHESRYVVTAGHTFWLSNSGNSHASFAAPLHRGVFGLGVLTSSIADIEARNGPGDPDGTFEVNYYAFAGAYARRFGILSLGVTGMYLYEQLYQLSASGYAFNAGATAHLLSDRVHIATSILNTGRMEILAETRSPLPTVWKSGVWAELAQFSISGSDEIPVTVALGADLSIPLTDDGATDGVSAINDPWIGTAVEITISDLLQFRAGYRTGATKRPFSTGIGLVHRNIRFNYAFVPFETGFGSTHSLAVTFFFD